MTSPAQPAPHGRSRPRRVTRTMVVCAAGAAFALASLTALAPPPTIAANDQAQGRLAGGSQTLTVSDTVTAFTVARDDYAASGGLAELSAGSTNHDWAELVLFLGNFPTTDSNITVMLRWMRQENGPDNWWNRNNPLNNGWGSGGNSGLGSYDNLVIAAENAAEALHSNPGYSGIVAGFTAAGATEGIEQAIWASPWATSHYANGGHWSYSPVPVIASPAGTW